MEAASQALSRGALEYVLSSLVAVQLMTDNVWCSAIFNDTDKAEKLFPVAVLQCLQVKQMAPSAQAGERWRLVVSDGEHYVQTMLATKANHVVHDGKLVRNCFIRVKQYQPNNVKGKKYVPHYTDGPECKLTPSLASSSSLTSK